MTEGPELQDSSIDEKIIDDITNRMNEEEVLMMAKIKEEMCEKYGGFAGDLFEDVFEIGDESLVFDGDMSCPECEQSAKEIMSENDDEHNDLLSEFDGSIMDVMKETGLLTLVDDTYDNIVDDYVTKKISSNPAIKHLPLSIAHIEKSINELSIYEEDVDIEMVKRKIILTLALRYNDYPWFKDEVFK